MPDDEDKTEVAKSNDVVESAVADLTATVTKAFSDLSEIVKAQAAQLSELSKSIEAVKNDVTASKDVFDEFGKRIDAVAADTAFRKSGDLGEIVQEPEVKVQKSLWGGRFLTNNDLFN
jgi:DNA repair ATPase RecN